MSSALLTVVESLSFAEDRREKLRSIPDTEWRRLLTLTDRAQLTLPLGSQCLPFLPPWVQERIRKNLNNNSVRYYRLMETYAGIAELLSSEGIEFMVLKGLAHWPLYCDDVRQRPQYDIDLYCPKNTAKNAYDALQSIGYTPLRHSTATPVDHLPPLIRMTGWHPRDDYYDPDMPLTVEVHFRFWDSFNEGFDVSGTETFWQRRALRRIGGLMIPTLHPIDALSYCTWHLVRHLFRGDLRAYHVYELAHFLQATADDDTFWLDWRQRFPKPLAEGIAFSLAIQWFECASNPTVRQVSAELPPSVRRWFEMFRNSPVTALEHPNKDELFLHLCLVKDRDARRRIIQRRLLPVKFHMMIVDAHVPSPNRRLRLKRRVIGTLYMVRRALHHLLSLSPVIINGLRWRRALAR